MEEKINKLKTEFLLEKRFRNLSLWLSITTAIIGFLVLLGWMLENAFLKSISPNWISMKANTALCFLIAGISISLQNPIKWNISTKLKKTVSVSATCIFTFIAAFNLFEYLFNVNFGIDELFFKEDSNPFATLHPGRMAPITVVCFLLLSVSNLFTYYKNFKPLFFQIPLLIICINSLIGLAGYIFNAEEMYTIGGFDSMAFLTVLCFLFLSIASLSSHPQDGIMAVVSSDTIGGKLIRKVFPFAVVLIFLLGWLHREGERMGVFNLNFGTGIFMLSFIIIFAIIL